MPVPSSSKSEVIPVMIGTAGHVDHGKTSLVRHLTGCDTDRLKEEKARGLTIDLGFAPCRFGKGRLAGIIDVPGHEDFIRNMAAGASSMDIVLLVVAADDGVMPQTDEHLRIIKALRPARVMVVITKSDLADEARREDLQLQVMEFLERVDYADAPILFASNTTFEGLTKVRETLEELVESVERTPDPRAFRMYIERVFSVKGYGTVVTGIPLCGSVAVGDSLELLPEKTKHALRAVQNYKLDADRVMSNACAALNLRDLDAADVQRGMTVSVPGIYSATPWLVAHVHCQSKDKSYKRVLDGSFHVGTGHVNATMKLIDSEKLLPGQNAFALILLEKPLTLASGDRFILRTHSPSETFADGTVLTVREYRLRRNRPETVERLQMSLNEIENGNLLMAELMAGGVPFIACAEAARLTQLPQAEAADFLREMEDDGQLVKAGAWYLLSARKDELIALARKRLARFHEERPHAWGMEPDILCAEIGLDSSAANSAKEVLTSDDNICERHSRLALPTFEMALPEALAEKLEILRSKVEKGGMHPPAIGNIKEELGIIEKDMRRLIRLLSEENSGIRIGVNIMTPLALEDCRKNLLALFERQDTISVADFREATGTSRNLAIELLERFDSEGLTVRSGNIRRKRG